MKSTWVVCALLANMSFEQAKATQIAQAESRQAIGNLVPFEEEELVGGPTSSSDSSASDVQESDEEPEHSEFLWSQAKKREAAPEYTYSAMVRDALPVLTDPQHFEKVQMKRKHKRDQKKDVAMTQLESSHITWSKNSDENAEYKKII